MRQHVNPLKRELQVWEHVLLAALSSLPSSLPRGRSVVMHSTACVVFPDGSTLAHYSLSCRWMSVTLLPNSPPPACWACAKETGRDSAFAAVRHKFQPTPLSGAVEAGAPPAVSFELFPDPPALSAVLPCRSQPTPPSGVRCMTSRSGRWCWTWAAATAASCSR